MKSTTYSPSIPNNYDLFILISKELNLTPYYFGSKEQVAIGPVYYNTVSCQAYYHGYWTINKDILGIEVERGIISVTKLVKQVDDETYYTKNKITIELANPKLFEILQQINYDWIWLKYGQDRQFPDSMLFYKQDNETIATPIYHLTNNLPPVTPVLEEEKCHTNTQNRSQPEQSPKKKYGSTIKPTTTTSNAE